MNIIKKTVLALALTSSAFAGSYIIEDFDYTLNLNGSAISLSTFEARWGTFSGQVFTPLFGIPATDLNKGYISSAGDDMTVSLSAPDNSAPLALNTPLALALTTIADDADYSASAAQIVLIDPSWKAPSFTITSSDTTTFSANTTVLGAGTFSYNSGIEIINIVTTAIPEPSTFAALAGVSVLGLAALRRRRA